MLAFYFCSLKSANFPFRYNCDFLKTFNYCRSTHLSSYRPFSYASAANSSEGDYRGRSLSLSPRPRQQQQQQQQQPPSSLTPSSSRASSSLYSSSLVRNADDAYRKGI